MKLDEFIIAERRVIHDFVDDDRANARRGVRGTERPLFQRRPMLLPRADEIASEADAIRRRAIFKAVAITCEVCACGTAAEQIKRFTARVQRKARWHTWLRIELRLGENCEAASSDASAIRDSELCRLRRIIA